MIEAAEKLNELLEELIKLQAKQNANYEEIIGKMNDMQYRKSSALRIDE